MSSSKLKEDLSNCLINFDRRVLITELLDDYRLSYAAVDTIVQNYVAEQEDKLKFEKRYLVHGFQEGEQKKEIYKVVDEKKVKDWLNKLKNAESSLYSIEIAGGAKSPAPIFKPMRIEECVKATSRQKTSAANGEAKASTSVAVEQKKVKQEKGVIKTKEPSKEADKINQKEESSSKKTSPKKETSPPEKKASVKKGINNFFAPSTTTAKKSEDKKPASGVMKPPTPKKMQDFFKKQTEKAANIEKQEKPAANKSMQLFDEEEDVPPEEVESSDEEEKLDALKRDIISSDVEMDDENESKAGTGKRRRILDSEDEEDPPVKQEKLDLTEDVKEEEPVTETYLDEDGFVITKKPKQKSTSTKKKSPTAKKTPPVTMKTFPKEAKKPNSSLKNDTKASKTAATAKTKQAGIMNFFSKK